MKSLIGKLRFGLAGKSETEVAHAIVLAVTINSIPQLLVWGLVFRFYGQQVAASLLFGWAVFTIVPMLLYWFRPASLNALLPCHFVGVLLINAAVSLQLGGLVQSYGQFLWGFLVPMGALVVYGPRRAVYYFFAYVGLMFALVPLSTPAPPALPATVGHIMTGLNMSITGGFIFLSFRYFIAKKNLFYSLLKQEEEKSDRLLCNILPEDIADMLKNGAGTIAVSYENASILFLDLVGFTRLAARIGPDATVGMLNAVFCQFDDLVDKYGLEKIKTIGDCYMVASGLPQPRDDHAGRLVAFALELQEIIRAFSLESGEGLAARIGIHSGPVTAGVIGKRKFAFDVWGDTVNTASRMESHGIVDKIHVSADTFRLIEGRFHCEPRGEIDIKGKGGLNTWIVVGPDGRTTATVE